MFAFVKGRPCSSARDRWIGTGRFIRDVNIHIAWPFSRRFWTSLINRYKKKIKTQQTPWRSSLFFRVYSSFFHFFQVSASPEWVLVILQHKQDQVIFKMLGLVSIVISLDLFYVVEVLNTEVFLLFKSYFNNIYVGFMYKEIKSLVDWFLIWYPPWLQWRPVPAFAACVFWNISIKASRSLPLVYILLIIEDLIRQLNCVVCIKCALLCTY